MIRINLLPGPKGHKAKPQYDVRAQALLGVGMLFITLAGCWWYSAALDEEINARQTEKLDREKQVAQLKEQVKRTSSGVLSDHSKWVCNLLVNLPATVGGLTSTPGVGFTFGKQMEHCWMCGCQQASCSV